MAHPIFLKKKHAFRGGVSSQIGKTIGLKRSRLSLLGTRRGDSSPHTFRFQTAWKQPTLGVDAFLIHMIMHISCDFNFQLELPAFYRSYSVSSGDVSPAEEFPLHLKRSLYRLAMLLRLAQAHHSRVHCKWERKLGDGNSKSNRAN